MCVIGEALYVQWATAVKKENEREAEQEKEEEWQHARWCLYWQVDVIAAAAQQQQQQQHRNNPTPRTDEGRR